MATHGTSSMTPATTTAESPTLHMALRLLAEGYWPIPIYPVHSDDGKSAGKRPIGLDWGARKPTPESLRKVWADYPNAGVGIKLGKEGGVVDFDVDDPDSGDDTFMRTMGGEIVETFGWSSERGYHALFKWDDRIEKYGRPVVRNHPNYPGLELRFGDNGDSGKSYQTVVPPSPDSRNKAREWNGIRTIAKLPPSVYADLDKHLVKHETTAVSMPTASPGLGLVVSAPSPTEGMSVIERAQRYIAKMPDSVSGSAGHDRLYNVAAVLVGDFLLNYEQALPIFSEWNALHAHPPESPKQVEHKLLDALKHAERTGRLAKGREPEIILPEMIFPEIAAASSEDIATAADLVAAQAGIEWIWEGWIQKAVLTLLAAEGGTGKTRFCLDLCRRIANGLPWPDGAPPTFPAGSPTLWIPADGNHAELAENPSKFGFPPELIFLNTSKTELYGGTELQTQEQYAKLEFHIRCIQPAIVFIDTITNSSDAKTQDASDAKRQYKPLQQIAQRTGTPIICITHLNSQGKTLGRRADEKVRVTIRMTRPDPDNQPNRRKLWVTKSNSLMPAPLGVTMGDAGNEYDLEPPKEPEEGGPFVGGQTNAPPSMNRVQECAMWLKESLSFGPMYLKDILETGKGKGYNVNLIYRAKDMAKVSEDTTEARKRWELP